MKHHHNSSFVTVTRVRHSPRQVLQAGRRRAADSAVRVGRDITETPALSASREEPTCGVPNPPRPPTRGSELARTSSDDPWQRSRHLGLLSALAAAILSCAVLGGDLIRRHGATRRMGSGIMGSVYIFEMSTQRFRHFQGPRPRACSSKPEALNRLPQAA